MFAGCTICAFVTSYELTNELRFPINISTETVHVGIFKREIFLLFFPICFCAYAQMKADRISDTGTKQLKAWLLSAS